MGKGGFNGGSTLVGPTSGWFTTSVRKKKVVDRATACGNAAAMARKDEREGWKFAENKTRLLSPDELNALIGPRSKTLRSLPKSGDRTDVAGSVPSGKGLARAKREKRQAAKRKRLGIPEPS